MAPDTRHHARYALAKAILSCALIGTLAGCVPHDTEGVTTREATNAPQQRPRSERSLFVDTQKQRLDDVEREIDRLLAKMHDAPPSVTAEQRERWNDDLFDLQEDRYRIQLELDRVQKAPMQEWEGLRGKVTGAIDSLQASVATLEREVSAALSSDEHRENGAPWRL